MKRKFNSHNKVGYSLCLRVAGLIAAACAAIYGTRSAEATVTVIPTMGAWTITATATPSSGKALEVGNVATTNNVQGTANPDIGSTYLYSGSTNTPDVANLPSGNYSMNFDFEFLAKPSTFSLFIRGDHTNSLGNSSGSNFGNPTIGTSSALNEWFNAATTVTIPSGNGSWIGDFEIATVVYPNVTTTMLLDNISLTDGSGNAVFVSPLDFASDSLGVAPPTSQILNSGFSTFEVVAVPEPATFGLMCIGGLGILLLGKRRTEV